MQMNKINLYSLPLAELIRIEKELPKAIVKAKKSEKIVLRKKIEALAAKSGFELDEILSKKPKKQKRTVKPKYKNPDDHAQTWTGRGRKPKWAEKFLKEGGSLEDLLI